MLTWTVVLELEHKFCNYMNINIHCDMYRTEQINKNSRSRTMWIWPAQAHLVTSKICSLIVLLAKILSIPFLSEFPL